MQLLQSNDRVALPIYDEVQQKFIGVAHIFAITMALLEGAQPEKLTSSEEVIRQATRVAQQTIGDLLFKGVTECLVCSRCNDPMEKAIKTLSTVPHRVLVTMTEEEVENKEDLTGGGVVEGRYRLISQVDVVRFLIHHQHELEKDLVDRVLLSTVEELGLATDRPAPCFYTEGKLALDAFNEMKEVPPAPPIHSKSSLIQTRLLFFRV
jgi:hypothetical protein